MMDIYKVISKEFSTSDRRGGRDNLPIYLRKGSRNTLADVYRIMGFNRGAEIGTRKGDYAIQMCKRHPSLHLYCIDPWTAYSHIKQDVQDQIYDIAVTALSPYNVTIIRKFSLEAVKAFRDSTLDFVFIDGNHTFDYAVADIIFWSHKVRPGGIVAVHDYMPGTWHGVMQAVDSYTHCHDIRPWFTTRERESTAFWVKPDDNRLLR